MNLQKQVILQRMLEGPPNLYMLCVTYMDQTHDFFVFDNEESQMEYVDSLVQNASKLSVERIYYGENPLNYRHTDESLFIVH